MTYRIAMALSYDGANYHGWQHQEAVSSIQQKVEQALMRVANHEVTVMCAGRTDAGVHATAQVVHFDTEANRNEHAWVFGVNSNLPHDISALWAREVPKDFHARHCALSRTYRYLLCTQPVRPGIFRKSVSWTYKSLDLECMRMAAEYLIGEHDFSAFRASGCQAQHAVRTIHALHIEKQGQMIVFEVKANAFVLHMVRNIVGVLVTIGQGDRDPHWALAVLNSRDRTKAALTAQPNGLYLVNVEYPANFNLPKTPKGPFFLP
ncbi:MAG: tRNA pseudouridine(38-40) synthase TruA [Gammaproteobacteria bacterium RIFCSPLOWO2_02_FULL_42_14]|nr:MAG: tRNA pseudouridine(38-40) synthase TruA [Gammaproteobacteria bacterium RIFCSPHIGHO2_02_FULL_42_43]OGT50807.1 MAG: tRNA pseudouridine(38-40) synthase TruA [Gammaproteobacteria bacterium RIFCSPHIGHO2_12_FULL_41_25]OGT61790.1 MAG: tRNA pseudouridine(38-40) synthase TruA [Gammaproteobacteria bacterium RIFCSPLOWO2_02_FULL_42_14]OGT85535.1 MAG: tRNA pseudouridine(38-40) synthase TruA [Gammaproteobacteria bacterium RIFCSPLOWO2_12_FULL_42_18]